MADTLSISSTETVVNIPNSKREYVYVIGAEMIECTASRLLSKLTDSSLPDHFRFIGYDSEFDTNNCVTKLAIIQLATRDTCYIFYVLNLLVLPSALNSILKSDKIIKIGFNTRQDLSLLRSCTGIDMSMLDLHLILSLKGDWNCGLSDATVKYCGYELDKTLHLEEKLNWKNPSDKQRLYAALDAFACVDIWNALNIDKIGNNNTNISISNINIHHEIEQIGETYINYDSINNWLKRVPEASSKEGLVRQLVNSYSPWAKLDVVKRGKLAKEAAENIWTNKEKEKLDNVKTVTARDEEAEIDIIRATELLRGTMHKGETRKIEKVVNQLYNSLGIIRCQYLSIEDKKKYLKDIVEILVERNILGQCGVLHVCLK